jgi:hypothetical protein
MSDESLAALAGASIYQRTARLVQVQRDEHHQHHVQALEVPHLRGLLSRRANFYSLTVKGNRMGCVPPKTVVEDLLARGDWPFPPLDGVVETPCLRPDGTVLDRPGYDAATRLVYAPASGLQVPPVPAHPTAAQVAAARALLFEPFYDFPFETDADVAAVLGLLLTVVMRPAIPGKVPLALIDAPKQGTGKSLLAEVVSIIGTGAAVPVSTLPTRPEEWRKWITAQLVAGRAMIQLDNLVGTLHSPELAAALTADTWSDRLLGSNDKTVTVPNRAVWVATGNNMKVAGDMPRRCYRIRVDARARDPQAREGWRHDPLVPWVRQHRSELLGAALTIARAWYAAGQPRAAAGSRLGSFEAWQSIIGGVLGFAAVPGFLANLGAFREEADDEGNALEAWMLALRERFGDARFKALEVVAALHADGAVRELAPSWLGASGGEVGKRVGKLLASVSGQVFGEWRLDRQKGHGGILMFSFRPQVEAKQAEITLKAPGVVGFEMKPTIKPTPEVESPQGPGGYGGFPDFNVAHTRAHAHARTCASAHGPDGGATHQSHETHHGPEASPDLVVTLDLETRSLVDLKRAGAWVYARDPSTSFLCLVARIGDLVLGWVPYLPTDCTGAALAVPGLELFVGEACPPPLRAAIEAGAIVDAHNAEFEAACWEHVAVARWGWPAVRRWRCTAAAAAAAGLPRSLQGASRALGLAGKLEQGSKLIKRLCMPNGDGMFNEPTVAEMVAFLEYNVQDVDQTLQIRRRLGDRLPGELEDAVWQAHLAVNRRGIAVDLQLAAAITDVGDRLVARAAEQAVKATGGTITGDDLTKRDKMLEWLASLGFKLDSLDADAVEKALKLAEDLDHQVVAEVLRARQAVSRTSLSKISALEAGACDDNRLRGMLSYWGAGPGRWTAYGFQPHNLPRPNPDVDVDVAIEAVLARDVDALLASGVVDKATSQRKAVPVMDALVACIRGCMTASPGKVLVAVDFAAIEARGVLWLAEDEKHLEWFRQNRDVYCEFGTKVYGRPIGKKDKLERQTSKNAVLGASYQMGAERFAEYAAENGVDLRAAGVTAELVISAYREEFESLSDYEYGLWHRMGDGAMQCVRERVAVQVGKHIRFEMRGDALLMFLPSGRYLTYHQPRLEVDPRFGREGLTYLDCTYRVPQRERTFGGKLTENATQATCRDLLASALVPFADQVVLHVHDELVLEVPEAEGEATLERLLKAMTTPPSWAEGFPINAEGWVSRRYRK